MKETHTYTEFHPRWHRQRMSTWWWLKRRQYVTFILRELSSLGVAWFVLFLLLLVHAVNQGESAYKDFLIWAGHPLVVLVSAVSLVLAVYHAATWFNLAPQAMVVRYKGRRVPGLWIAGANYAAWVLVSGLVVYLLLKEG
jgi:fumarate reductase subunit C